MILPVEEYVVEGYFAFEDWEDEEDFECHLLENYIATTFALTSGPGVGFRISRDTEADANTIFEEIIEVCKGELNIRMAKHLVETLAEYDGDTEIDIE